MNFSSEFVLVDGEFFNQPPDEQLIDGKDGYEYLLRFKREVRLLTKELLHENIIEIIKVNLDEPTSWFTMPIANFTLSKWINDNKNASDIERNEIFKSILANI